jgi:type VI protein secretion system component VasK
MEWLILLAFLLGWLTCWTQEKAYLNRVQKELESELVREKESAKDLLKQLNHHSETVVAQEMQILKLQEKVLAQDRELDELRYRI